MKYLRTFRIAFLVPFLLFIGAFAFLQTSYMRGVIKDKIISIAEQQGVALKIDSIEGCLPTSWTFHGIEIQHNGISLISLNEVEGRIAFLPLFKRQLEITFLKASEIQYQDQFLSLDARLRYDLGGRHGMRIPHLCLEGEYLYIRGEGKFSKDLSLRDGYLSFSIPDCSLIHPQAGQGKLIGTANLTKNQASIYALAEDLFINGIPFAKSTLSLEANWRKSWWEGQCTMTSGHIDVPMSGTAQFRYTPACELFSIDRFQVEGDQLDLYGKVDFDPSFRSFEGTVIGQCFDLTTLRPLLPGSFIEGQMGAKIDLKSYNTSQDLTCQIELEGFNAYHTRCNTLIVESSLFDLFGDIRGEFSVEGRDVSYLDIAFSHLDLQSSFEPHSSPFSFACRGTWDDPFEIQGGGRWQKRNNGVFFNVDAFDGIAFQKPFELKEAFSIDWNADQFKMSNFSVDIADGHLFSRIDLTKSTSLIKVHAEEFPLEFIRFPHKHFSLAGSATFDVDLVSWEDNIQGICNVALKRGRFITQGVTDTTMTKGSLQIHLSPGVAQVHGELKGTDGQFCHLNGRIPIRYQHFPFQVRIDPDQPISAQLVTEGKLENIFDFINIGSHRVEGWLSAKVHVSKTLNDPALQGWIDLQDGLYENYFTGTLLKHISAKARACQQTVHITDLHASDGDEGTVSATGSMLLSPTGNYPFSISANLTDLNTVSFDTITGKFSGKVTISGDQEGATAKGKLKVAEATMKIPDTLPSALPPLPITFVNPPESIRRKGIATPTTYPLHLDLQINAPEKTYVQGRGLNSELKGKIHLTGTYTDIAAKGTLQLLKGEFLFSGKVFNLTQGELIFNDSPTPSAYISLSGTCNLPEVTVNAILRGPLTEPKLSFQSTPQLPTSSLLAQILFNKDISEISAVQALQIAQTVISLSGNTAPDILEKIRKSLGIDRLTLITSENDPGKISLQIGKYLMRGVLLTLSQGAESRNVTVEVDLKRGVSFQAEMNEEQQGKFSLKWHHHY